MVSHFDKSEIADRFIRYAGVYTQSKEGVADTPSTACQRDLAKLLYEELKDMGAAEVFYDEDKCYVYAAIPGNIPADKDKVAALKDAGSKRRENLAPVIGLIAHMDTSDAVDAKEIHPRRIDGYDGGEIILNSELDIRMNPEMFPDLADKKGKTLIVSDGTSVLGGDDKAGVTQIMEVFSFFLANPDIPHGTIRLMFTPDEEVGNGTMNFSREHFAVDYAYTVDGGGAGELEYENFNAAGCSVVIKGQSTHPGSAKGVMKNAVLIGMEFNSLLPEKETPFYTDGYEGFYHITDMRGTCDEAEVNYIIRDHDREKFEERKKTVLEAAEELNRKYGEGTVTANVTDSYYNMAEKVKPHMHLIENAKQAMLEVGITPLVQPIRGGTDGCRLSYEGIPCPNLFTGAYNFHSRYEYVAAEEMEAGAEVLLRILNKYAAYELDT